MRFRSIFWPRPASWPWSVLTRLVDSSGSRAYLEVVPDHFPHVLGHAALPGFLGHAILRMLANLGSYWPEGLWNSLESGMIAPTGWLRYHSSRMALPATRLSRRRRPCIFSHSPCYLTFSFTSRLGLGSFLEYGTLSFSNIGL